MVPIPEDTCRQVWGSGVRAGMYPLNSREVYWFTVFNTSQVSTRVSIWSAEHWRV